jgi:scyllo-inositol 2-dehydrogenase (NADP+)
MTAAHGVRAGGGSPEPAGTPVRTAVIGFGSSGRTFHAPFLDASPDFSLDVLVTGDPGRQQSAHELYPRARVLPDVEALFGEADTVDLVVIGSPPATHVPLARRAVQLGLPVVVDKPFCVRADEGQQLVEEAARSGVPLTAYQNRRWDGDFLTLRALVDTGALGTVRRFESRFEWWKPDEPKVWKRESLPSDGGGVLFDLGTHLIDQAIQLFGPVHQAHAELAAHRTPGVDDDSFVSLLHASGVRSQLWMNGLAGQAGPRFRVLGSTSAYQKWGLDSQEAALKAGTHPNAADYGVEPEAAWGVLGVGGQLERVRPQRGAYDRFYSLLADALRTGSPLPVDPLESVEVIALIERLHRESGVRDALTPA